MYKQIEAVMNEWMNGQNVNYLCLNRFESIDFGFSELNEIIKS